MPEFADKAAGGAEKKSPRCVVERKSMNLLNHSGIACSRRDFIRMGITGAVAAALGSRLAFVAEAAKKKIPVGLELYSVREACAKDLPGTLKIVKEIGFSGVEFAGYHGKTAKELRQLLDDNGLKCYGTHTGLDTLRGDNLKKSIEFNQIIGNRFLICPWMNGETIDGWNKLAEEFNNISDIVQAEKIGKKKMFVGYHAHAHDFHKIGDQVPWDVFFGNTKKEVIMQLDTSNCLDGGTDPLAVLKKYPKRGRSIHLKEHGGDVNTYIGMGDVKWEEVFKFCEKDVAECYIVENERGGNAEVSIKSARGDFEGLKKLGKV